MRELTWKYNKARIWFDEFPNWKYEATQVVEYRLPTCSIQNEGLREVAVEMLIPVGPMAMYGALGATFLPEPRGDLLIQILVSSCQEQRYYSALVSESERAYIGLPKQYAKGLLESVISLEQTRMLGIGTLSFCGAIHGEIGSSAKLFQVVSSAVIRLLCLKKESLSDSELLEMLWKSG